MKKTFSFFSILLILFLVSACDLPNKIHISGTPKLRFAADLDFTNVFEELMFDAFTTDDDDSDENLIVKNCVNAPDLMTFLIRMELVNVSIDISSKVGNTTGSVSETKLLTLDTITLPLYKFADILPGFRFNTENIKSRLFFSGSDVVKKFKLILNEQSFDVSPLGKSGIIGDEVYEDNKIPAGGVSADNIIIPAFKTDGDLEIDLDIFLKAGTYTSSELTSSADFVTELVIWLPLEFIAGEEARFELPGFEALGEFLSSLATDSGDMIKSLQLEIGLENNPFKEGTFIAHVEAEDIFKIDMNAQLISFNVRTEDIAYINIIKEIVPEFKTEFFIKFEKSKHLKIPKTLKIMSIAMETEIDHTISFGGGEAE